MNRYEKIQTENVAEEMHGAVETAAQVQLDQEEEARQAKEELDALEKELLDIQAAENQKETIQEQGQETETQIENTLQG